jgi:hypothetical protein
MNISFTVSVCGKQKESWSYKREHESTKQFDIDLPDGFPLPDFTPMITGVIHAAVSEHEMLKAIPDEVEDK